MSRYILFIVLLSAVLESAEISPSLRIDSENFSGSRSGTFQRVILLHSDGSVTVSEGENAVSKALLDTTVIQISAGKIMTPVMDSVRKLIHCDQVHQGVGLGYPYTGKGVIVGVVDGGFDYSHPAFRTNSGASRILQIWDQKDSTGTAPAKFTYGSELKGGDAVLAKMHDSKISSHGTHVASCAAGSMTAGVPYYGTAPESDLIFVTTTYESQDVINAVEYILSAAESLNKPVVINMSLASPNGAHDGTSAEDKAMEAFSKRGVMITAASNSGHVLQHIQMDLKKGDTLRTFMTLPDREGMIDFWGEPFQQFRIIPSVTDASGNVLHTLKPITSAADYYDTSIVINGDTIRIQGAGSFRSAQNGKPTVLMAVSSRGTLVRSHDIAVAVTGTAGTIHGWNGMYRSFTDRGIPGYIKGNSSMTIGDGPGTSRGAITVGASTSRKSYRNWNDSLIEQLDTSEIEGIAFFSSKGPTLDGRNKPELTAPGHSTIGAWNSFDTTLKRSMTVQYHSYEGREYPYAGEMGTSLAAPVAAGAAALMLEAAPDLTQNDILTIFEMTSVKDEKTSEPYRWGFGKLDAAAALAYVEKNFTAIQSVQNKMHGISVVRENRSVKVLSGDLPVKGTFSLFTANGRKVFSGKTGGEALEIPGSAGIYFYTFTREKERISGRLFIPAYR